VLVIKVKVEVRGLLLLLHSTEAPKDVVIMLRGILLEIDYGLSERVVFAGCLRLHRSKETSQQVNRVRYTDLSFPRASLHRIEHLPCCRRLLK
jgi:hypothetical protein